MIAYPVGGMSMLQLSSDGNVCWVAAPAGFGQFQSLASDGAGGVILATLASGTYDVDLVHFDASGTVAWRLAAASGGAPCADCSLYRVLVAADGAGGVVAVAGDGPFGSGTGAAWVARADAGGHLLWKLALNAEALPGNPLGGSGPLGLGDFAVDGTRGIVRVSGGGDGFVGPAWLAHLDLDGHFVSASAGGAPRRFDAQGGIYIEDRSGAPDAWALRHVDEQGSPLWSLTLGADFYTRSDAGIGEILVDPQQRVVLVGERRSALQLGGLTLP
jgi:hypothetical protein